MHISRSDRETAAFVLKWSDLEKLLSSISSSLPIVTISASCADKLDREFANVEELHSFGNPARAAITELRLVARDQECLQRFSLSLSNDPRHNVRISIDGDESTAIKINDIYQDFLDSIRPWYSGVAKTDWYFVIVGVCCFICIVFLIIAIVWIRSTKTTSGWSKDGVQVIESFLFGLIPSAIGAAMNKFKSKFFPTGTFAFGDGKKRYDRSESIRSGLIVSFAVSIAASVSLSWLQ